MRYNVGDEVRVKKELSLDHKYDGFCWVAQPMEAFFGKVITIEEIQHEANKGYYYVVKENEWFWTDEMLEPVAVRVPILKIDWSDWDELDSPISRAAKDIAQQWEGRFRRGFVWDAIKAPRCGVKVGVPREMTVEGRRITPILKQVDSETIKIIDCFNKETRYRWDGCKWNEIGTKKSTGIESRKDIRKRLLNL